MLLSLAALSAANAQQPGVETAADPVVEPSVEIPSSSPARLTGGVRSTVTFSDNIDLTDQGESSGTTLEIGPYVRYLVDTPRLQSDVYYGLRYFTTSGDLGEKGLRHDLRSKIKSALWKDSFWISGRASVVEAVSDPVSAGTVDPARQEGQRSTVQRFALAPYFTGTLNDRNTSYVAGYGASFSKNSNRSDAQITQKLIGNVTRDPDRRGLGWLLESEASNNKFESSDQQYDTTRLTAEALIRANRRLRAGVGVEYNKVTALQTEDGQDSGWAPTVSVGWTPNRRTSLNARYSKPYFGSTGSAQFSYQPSRWVLGLQYTYGLTDNATGPLASADVRGAFATDGRSASEDSVVGELLSDGVLPEFGTVLTDGFVSSAISRTRSLIATAGWTGKRYSLGLIAARIRSESQRLAIDLPTTPGAPAGLKQTRLSVVANRSVDQRTNAQASISTSISESGDGAAKSQIDTVSFSLLRQMTKQADVFARYRFANQKARSGSVNSYHEQAIVLGVNYRF